MTDSQLRNIQKFVYKKSVNITDPQHDLGHAQRVRSNTVKIAQILKLDKNLDLNLLTSMSLLHDMHYSIVSPGITTYLFEGRMARKFLKKIIAEFDLNQEEKNLLIEAIANHTHSYPLRRLNKRKDSYSKILQDADTLDFFSNSRLQTLKDSKRKFLFYRLIWRVGRKFYYRNKKQIKKYLNYPELVNHLTGFNIS